MTKTRSAWGGWVLGALIVVLALGLVALGFWQLSRLAQRRAQNAVITARLAAPPVDLNPAPPAGLPEYQPVRLRGTYDFSHEVVLRNRAHLDAPGVHVLTPLRLTGSDQAVLVDRGWIPYQQAAPEDRSAYQWPAGEVSLDGLVRPAQQRESGFLPVDQPLSAERPRLDAWFRVDLPRIQAQVPYPLLPYFVEAAAGADPQRLPISGGELDLSNGPHLGYALQWFAFAVILVVGSLALWRQQRGQGAAGS